MKADLHELLGRLALIGESDEGGVTRLLYTEPWKRAQECLAGWMEEAGLEVYYDEVGNLFGRLAGSEEAAGAVLTGSHVDTVRQGGRYDGAYGICAGLLAISELAARHGRPRRTLELVAFCEEEGSRFPLAYWGSGNVTGIYSAREIPDIRDAEGISLRTAMREAGFGSADTAAEEVASRATTAQTAGRTGFGSASSGPEEASHASRSSDPDGAASANSCPALRSSRRTDIAAYVELHIEQGGKLEATGIPVGIVDGIVGQRRWAVRVEGAANHAGTTDMGSRRDALAGAAEMSLLLEAWAGARTDGLVATVGSFRAEPGVPNVIPGAAEFTVDIRHSSPSALDGFARLAQAEFRAIAERRNLTVRFATLLESEPVPMDGRLTDRLAEICRSLNIPHARLFSGAGHDAQLLAGICPAAMIFVPSRDGISHSPLEYTAPEQLETGLNVLAELLYTLAYKEVLP